ncbi:MAG: sigma-70 family RNA polymerase sigma factor [Anaerohalosphaera sp.]|nr:sigma-70 family RNA polymerase sigma factor [Anaerohalosphaera sp.]
MSGLDGNYVGRDEEFSGDSKADRFFRLFMGCQSRVYSYILILVPDSNDADDIMQETATVLWNKFDQYEDGTNFIGWAVTIARYRVLHYRWRKRRSMMHFNDDLWNRLEVCASEGVDDNCDRFAAVRQCTSKLAKGDRKLIELRYGMNMSTRQVAEMTGRSRTGLYRSLSRIHSLLHECVRNTLASWEMT